MQPRFFPEYKEEFAAYIKYNFDETNSIGFSYLQKGLVNTNNPINIYSTQYTITPFKDLVMDVEYSFGKEHDDIGTGYSIELVNQTEKTYASIQMIDAGQDYPGYYNNTRYLTPQLRPIRFHAKSHPGSSDHQESLYVRALHPGNGLHLTS